MCSIPGGEPESLENDDQLDPEVASYVNRARAFPLLLLDSDSFNCIYSFTKRITCVFHEICLVLFIGTRRRTLKSCKQTVQRALHYTRIRPYYLVVHVIRLHLDRHYVSSP